DMGSGIGIAKRRATELLRNRTLTSARLGGYKIAYGKSGIIPFAVTLDDEPITSSGEITINFYSPLANPKRDEIDQENQARGSKGRTLWWIAADDKTVGDKLKRLEALDKVPARPKWKNDRSDETVRLLKEKEKERAGLETHVAGLLEAAVRQGRLYYAGEATDLDGSKDLKTAAAEFVGTVAGYLYTRFAIADKTFDEKTIPEYLKPGKKGLDRLNPELGLYDAEGHLIRHAPLAATLFDELRRRKDENEDLDGKALADHFERIPFGWPDALVRLVLAAMFRGGAVYLESPDSDQPIYELSALSIEGLFTGPQKFRKTRFMPTTGGLSPMEVKDAKDALIALGETGLPDAAHGLAERVRAVGLRLTRQADRIRQRVDDLRLPLPDTYRRAEPITKGATELRDPVACVRKFVEDRSGWRELFDFVTAYEQFVEQKRDVSFQDYAAVLEYARACPPVFDGEAGRKVKTQLAEFDAVVAAREIMPKWKTLQEAALAVIDRYRQVYRAAYEACAQAVAQLRGEVEASAAVTRLDGARRARVLETQLGPNSPLFLGTLSRTDTATDLRRASERRKVSELDALRLAVSGYRAAIFQQAEQEWQAQQAASPTPSIEPARPVERVSLRAKLAGRRFVSRAEFEAFWQSLGAEVAAKFDAGHEVVIDE
ncbi:MAG: hypothetical protein KA765_19255, partial [Thermoflexales bacterium]|nr:hypothetical protein [Thermoflexales bacterium]